MTVVSAHRVGVLWNSSYVYMILLLQSVCVYNYNVLIVYRLACVVPVRQMPVWVDSRF